MAGAANPEVDARLKALGMTDMDARMGGRPGTQCTLGMGMTKVAMSFPRVVGGNPEWMPDRGTRAHLHPLPLRCASGPSCGQCGVTARRRSIFLPENVPQVDTATARRQIQDDGRAVRGIQRSLAAGVDLSLAGH